MSIFSLFTSRKPDVSKYAFVDTEVGTKDLLMDEIGRWNQLSRNQKKIFRRTCIVPWIGLSKDAA